MPARDGPAHWLPLAAPGDRRTELADLAPSSTTYRIGSDSLDETSILVPATPVGPV